MPKPVAPDRPIWPPLPTETDRRPDILPDAPQPVSAESEARTQAGGPGGLGTLPGRPMADAAAQA